MTNKKRENAVRNLVTLYTVIIGAALSLAVKTLVGENNGLDGVSASSALVFAAFIFMLIPFYHGALRHLDDAYIESDRQIKDPALMLDFFLLFLHGIVFVFLSLLLKSPSNFAWLLVGVLAIDVVWGAFVGFFGSSTQTLVDGEAKKPVSAESRWAIINALFIAIVVMYLFEHDVSLAPAQEPLKLSVMLACACFVRSLIDYWWCSRFYFPSTASVTQ